MEIGHLGFDSLRLFFRMSCFDVLSRGSRSELLQLETDRAHYEEEVDDDNGGEEEREGEEGEEGDPSD